MNSPQQLDQVAFFDACHELYQILADTRMLLPAGAFGLLLLTAVILISCGAWNGMALASREFREQSARKRTYIIRTTYALLAFLTAYAISYRDLDRVQNMGLEVLGEGRELFSVFVAVQFIGIFLFMPAMTCSLITSEKERDTLSLLMLTRLSPWGMILGKLISRVVPMMLFVGLSMPLCAFAYSLGGVDQRLILSAVYGMCLSILQCAALGAMCSSIFRTTVAAFIASYALGFALWFGLPCIDVVFEGTTAWLHRYISRMFNGHSFLGLQPYEFNRIFFDPLSMFDSRPRTDSIPIQLLKSLPMIVSIISMLCVARFFVLRRAFAQPRNLLLSLFRLADRLFTKANDQLGGVVVVSRNTTLPEDKPIRWRETTKKTLGTARYLTRILVAIEFPVAFFCALAVANIANPTQSLSLLLYFVWVIALLLISVSAACLIAAERSHQTLEVLLATPMQNRDILTQKFVGLRRMMLVLMVPFMTIYLFESWLKLNVPSLAQRSYVQEDFQVEREVGKYLAISALNTVLYLHMFALIAMLIGLKIRSQAKAIFASMGVFVGWCVLPFIVIIPSIDGLGDHKMGNFISLMSPISIIPLIETHSFDDPWIGFAVNSVLYGSVTLIAYWYIFYAPNGMLGRIDTKVGSKICERQGASRQ